MRARVLVSPGIRLARVLDVVALQAADETLWTRPPTTSEALAQREALQRALRVLHATIEGDEAALARISRPEDPGGP